MQIFSLLYPALLAATTLITPATALRSDNKVKLSQVQSLTLRKGLQSSHRRVSSIPQLNCIGGSAASLYEIDIMRCQNAGSDYGPEDIQWTCSASLPPEFKLGSTDVICEGYDYPDDPYILKGSCGVEYRLVLTDRGHEKYGKKKGGWFGDDDEGDAGREKTMGDNLVTAVFWLIFIGVAGWIVWNVVQGWMNGPAAGGVGDGNRPGWGGGGGGWGGNDDPPPPYDWNPNTGSRPGNKPSSYGGTERSRPGFWTGALGGAAGGAAAGYAAGNWGNNRQNNTGSGWGSGRWNNGEGGSRSSSGSSGSPSFSSERHSSTGFGSTSRR
ncbi:DUF1183-domain-containing protein [Massarina eburnea CBS 473.64]|uniref:Store-operated calcium entry-associated regulatory factor n=1 Tax=Massarina eburnea CBS 473.64 TaxID=1395130 RepID=A0A6A6RTX3_9PLEO|nr:DUF1183-domain-containing protein [Massarina eburnea CBS 473.64]